MFEIGNSLREARLRQGLDFPQVEQATKVRAKYLRALEDEHFEQLPAQPYVKGFLRTYAEYLGLDGQLYVDEYNSRYVTGEDEVPTHVRRSPSRDHRRFESNMLVFALAAIAVVTALVVIAWRVGSTGDRDTLIPNLGQPATQVERAKPKVRIKKPERPRRAAAPKPARLVMTAVYGDTWVEVRRGSAAGGQLFEGTLEEGETQAFELRALWLNVGRPQNLRLRLNGKIRRLPGDDSVVATVTAQGISPSPATP